MFESILKDFYREHRLKGSAESTIKEYETTFRYFGEWLLAQDRSFDRDSVIDFLLALKDEKQLADSTMHKHARNLRHLVNIAAEYDHIKPFKLTMPKVRNKEDKHYLTEDNVIAVGAYLDKKLEEFLEVYLGSPDSIPSRQLQEQLRFWLIIETGMRAEEALNLRWDDIDLERGTVYIRETKTNEPRHSAFNTLWHKAGAILEVVMTKSGYVLHRTRKRSNEFDSYTHKHGLPKVRLNECQLKYQGLRKSFDRLNAKVALPFHFTPHDLRRTYITLALQRGYPVNAVAKQVGHRDWRTTQGYDRTTVDDLVRILSGSPPNLY
jgi:integrase